MVANFFRELKKRNLFLFWFGIFNFFGALFVFSIWGFDKNLSFLIFKPIKYFLSIGIFSWSIGWSIYYLYPQILRSLYSWIVILTMFIHNGIVLLQTLRGVSVHKYNNLLPLDSLLFNLMSGCMLLLFLCILTLTLHFFFQDKIATSQHYTWGIRMGLVILFCSSLIGGWMLFRMSHTVGGNDGSAGLAFLNWSRRFGDLRVALFFGVHAFQIIPLVSHFFLTTKKQVIVFSVFYSFIIIAFFCLAIMKIPFI
jgi:hypothetical protein